MENQGQADQGQLPSYDAEAVKCCSHCKVIKPLTEFHVNKSLKDGKSRWCKVCGNKKSKYYSSQPGAKAKTKAYNKIYNQSLQGILARRKGRLKGYYGITLTQYENMWGQQAGLCAICGKPETFQNQYGLVNLSVDHCHKTGKVRSLLCHKCNATIGMVDEDIDVLEKMIKYLKNDLTLNVGCGII